MIFNWFRKTLKASVSISASAQQCSSHLIDDIRTALSAGNNAILLAKSADQASMLAGQLDSKGITAALQTDPASFSPDGVFVQKDGPIALLTTEALFHRFDETKGLAPTGTKLSIFVPDLTVTDGPDESIEKTARSVPGVEQLKYFTSWDSEFCKQCLTPLVKEQLGKMSVSASDRLDHPWLLSSVRRAHQQFKDKLGKTVPETPPRSMTIAEEAMNSDQNIVHIVTPQSFTERSETGFGLPSVVNVYIKASAISSARRYATTGMSDQNLAGYAAGLLLGLSPLQARNLVRQGFPACNIAKRPPATFVVPRNMGSDEVWMISISSSRL